MRLTRNQEPGGKADGAEAFGALFRHFHRILTLNNQILEMVADLDRALGGEYIFDHSFMQNSVTVIIEKGRQVIYHLNAMAADRYGQLYNQFTITADHLSDILTGGNGPYGAHLVLPDEVLHRDLVHLAGAKGANLGEVRNGLHLPAPPLFAVSVTGYRRFMEHNNLFRKINDVLQESERPKERATAIHNLFATAGLPADLKDAINSAVKRLRRQSGNPSFFAVRSSAVGEDGERSFAGQFDSYLDVPAKEVGAACLHVMAGRFSERVLAYIDPTAAADQVPMAVLVQPMIRARASGVLYTRDPGAPSSEVMIISAVPGKGESLVAGRDSGDRFVISRHHPFKLQASVIQPRTAATLPEATASTAAGLRRGSGVVDLALLRQLVEKGLFMEKRFELPLDIEWCIDQENRLWILQSRPLRLRRGEVNKNRQRLATDLARLPVLMAHKGHICQLGVASGRIVQVTEETPVDSFPIGAVAVSRYASPGLTGIVQRASAIITDIGSPTGHLATIAREYRTPALFGTEDATRLLTDGTEVMIDVEERTVYAGWVDIPVGLNPDTDFEPLSLNPEAGILRRLLRLIAPLNLIDPTASSFRMENCLTIHDFIRFCHERAVSELIGFHISGRFMAGNSAPFLKAEIPIKIRLIDIGGGLAQPLDKSITTEQVASRPLRYLLQGMLQNGAWEQEPASFGMRDFLSSLTRPLDVLGHSPDYSGENLAIIAENYCNLSLRLGYHFNIIDCYLSDETDDNYIYFRFVGGFAEKDKRARRAIFIDQVLSCLHFKVERNGDLVLGKAKMLERRHMENILLRLGELIAFTRQLDVRMVSDADVDRCFSDFLDRINKPSCPLER